RSLQRSGVIVEERCGAAGIRNAQHVMARHEPGKRRIESAEVKEAQRRSVDAIRAIIAARDTALLQVPVRDVVALVAKRHDAIEEAGNEIDPLLIDEEPALRLDDARILEPPLPPVEKRGELRIADDRDEAEVPRTGDEDAALTRVIGVVDRAREMRSERDERRSGRVELLEFAVNDDVRIEIDDAVVAAVEEMLDHPRLHSGVELEHRIAERE